MAALETTDISVGSPSEDLDGDLVTAGSSGDTAEVGTSNTFLVVKNGSASSVTVTIATPGSVDGLAISDFSQAIAAADYCIVPLGMVFASSTGRATITYSASTDVSVGAFRLVMR